jgi:hypothetical protein
MNFSVSVISNECDRRIIMKQMWDQEVVPQIKIVGGLEKPRKLQ